MAIDGKHSQILPIKQLPHYKKKWDTFPSMVKDGKHTRTERLAHWHLSVGVTR